MIDRILPRDILIVMGDWNARVRSNKGSEVGDEVLGKHRLREMNEVGLSMLTFAA